MTDQLSARIDVTARLTTILSYVDGHLRFGEAKNTALLALNAGIALGAIKVLTDAGERPWYVLAYFMMLLIGVTLSGLTALISFLPRTEIPWLHNRGETKAEDDLLFFGHIQKYTPDQFLRSILGRMGSDTHSSTPLDLNYARQIVINSRIASQKFTYFRYAIWLTVAGVLSPLLAWALHGQLYERDRI